MASEDETSKSGSLVDAFLTLGKESLGPLVDYGKQEIILSMLQVEAAKLTIWDGIPIMTDKTDDFVCSPQVRSLMKAYQFYGSDDDGVVLVGFGPQDSGKSIAAEFLLHGDHNFRPTRGLKISAAGMDDFAKDFGEKYLGQRSGALTASVLVDAVAWPAESVARRATGSTASATAQAFSWSNSRYEFDLTKPMKLRGDAFKLVNTLPGNFSKTPVLVIDDFNTASVANEKFITQLYTRASRSKIIVVLLTKEKDWATKLVKLNGGTKIVPIHSNVNNTWDIEDPFTEEPDWKDLEWEIECLRDLVRPKCKELGLDENTAIQKSMPPKKALRHVKKLCFGNLLD